MGAPLLAWGPLPCNIAPACEPCQLDSPVAAAFSAILVCPLTCTPLLPAAPAAIAIGSIATAFILYALEILDILPGERRQY